MRPRGGERLLPHIERLRRSESLAHGKRDQLPEDTDSGAGVITLRSTRNDTLKSRGKVEKARDLRTVVFKVAGQEQMIGNPDK
jgi:hypothetical protein